MDTTNNHTAQEAEPATNDGYLTFQHLPEGTMRDGKPVLNRFSSTLTQGHDFPGAQAMLYAAGVPDQQTMKNAPHVGIASVWWEGNPCKYVYPNPIPTPILFDSPIPGRLSPPVTFPLTS